MPPLTPKVRDEGGEVEGSEFEPRWIEGPPLSREAKPEHNRHRRQRLACTIVQSEEVGFVVKLELPSNPLVLSIVRSTVQQMACVAGFSEEQCRSITLAVDEALSNIIRHAYLNRHDQAIQLTCQCDNDGLEFLLVDHGQPVDPKKLRGRPLDEVRPGGLGTYLIAQIMDRVQYEPLPDRNQLRLVKHLSKKSPRGE